MLYLTFWICISYAVATPLINKEVAPRLTLNDGNKIPAFGLGTFLGFDENGQVLSENNEVTNAVKWALQSGYRLIDTASLYFDEDQVGRGVRESGVPREEVYVVTKLGLNEKRDVMKALKNSLQRLNFTYVDLYLIHFPVSLTPDSKKFDIIDYLDTWKSMEEIKKLGLAKSIGVSNFNSSQLQRLIENSNVKPAVQQIEVNLNLAQEELIDQCQREGIVVMGYTPFGSLFSKDPNTPAPKVDDPELKGVAQRYNKTVPQIVLRYLVQRGVVPIPKSINKNRIEQNIDIFDFKLSEEDMRFLSKYNKNYRVVWPTYWQDHPYYPFEKTNDHRPDPFKGIKN